MRYNFLYKKFQSSQKKRQKKTIKNKKIFKKTLYLFSRKGFFFECYNFIFLKKIFKKIFKKNNLFFNIFIIWIFLKFNFPISKKSKNSRMGNGNGKFKRWTIKVFINQKLLFAKIFSKHIFFIINNDFYRNKNFKLIFYY